MTEDSLASVLKAACAPLVAVAVVDLCKCPMETPVAVVPERDSVRSGSFRSQS